MSTVLNISENTLNLSNKMRAIAGLPPLQDVATINVVVPTKTIIGPTGAPVALTNAQAVAQGFITPEQNFHYATNANLINLGLASKDISAALNQQIAIRENENNQLKNQVNNLQIQNQQQLKTFQSQVSDALTSVYDQITGLGLGQNTTNANVGIVDKNQNATQNQVNQQSFFNKIGSVLGIGAAGAAIALGLIVLVVLKK